MSYVIQFTKLSWLSKSTIAYDLYNNNAKITRHTRNAMVFESVDAANTYKQKLISNIEREMEVAKTKPEGYGNLWPIHEQLLLKDIEVLNRTTIVPLSEIKE